MNIAQELPASAPEFNTAGTMPYGTIEPRRRVRATEGLGERERVSLLRGQEVIGKNVPTTPEKTDLSSANAASFRGRQVMPSTMPVQLWEGVVKALDASSLAMQVILTDKLGGLEDHAAEISLEWVSDQDKDLIRPGAVFYLTLYKEISPGGTCRNSQELRFRRLPNWTKREVEAVSVEASSLLGQFRPKPLASDE